MKWIEASKTVAGFSVLPSKSKSTYQKGILSISNNTGGFGYFDVVPGQTYLFRVLGYQQTGTNAKVVVSDYGSFSAVGPALPVGSGLQGWVEMEVTIPAGVTTLFIGVVWEGATTNDKFYVDHVSLYNRDWEYHYYTLDQLGNVRNVIQTKPTTITYTATMETENYSTESTVFQNLNPSNIVVNTSANSTPGGNEVIRLNATNRIGPTKSLKVFQEDIIYLTVKAYYATPPGSMGQIAGGVMANALLGVITSGGQAVVDGVNSAYNQSGQGNPNFTLGSYQGTSYPSAFLNYILFDENYVPIKAKSTPLTNNPNSIQTLTINTSAITKQGYLFAYVSYDNTNTSYDVYFDDFEVKHEESDYIQVNSYYPFGMLAYTWTRDAELENRLLF